ncbi:GNAT family N-acetyltransferase [Flavobacterium aquicola]|uniref:Ribosomal protein S18 acetylase RimI-like enzyme n=1 Tax=Flavobacterium aquicola TaxID=1682742 RepID=A0A3E0ESE0_9FLAO|nr:GNAT family N-acetyltransferase [Flavobacterium aquicola]REH01046.1 ribosomal protein S18 acetylase RimI-like enzyme [Flavobacterium aquicola]
MNNINIIKCNRNHSAIISDLIIDLLKDFNDRSGSSFVIDRNYILETINKLIDRETFGCYAAFENQVPIGLITISHSFAIYNGGDFGVITELYVDKHKRSCGIGKLLLEKAYEFAKQHNWSKLEVGAPNKSEWPRTIDFYKENGFEEKGPKLRLNLK